MEISRPKLLAPYLFTLGAFALLASVASADSVTVNDFSFEIADVADGAGDDDDDDSDEDGGSGRSTVWAEAKTHTVDQTGMQACVALHRIPPQPRSRRLLSGQRMYDDTNDVASNPLDLRTTTRCKQPQSSGHKEPQRGQAESGC